MDVKEEGATGRLVARRPGLLVSLPRRDQVEAHAVTKRRAAAMSRGPRSTPAKDTKGSQTRR